MLDNLTFVPAMEDTRPLTIAVSFAGGSGTGKTYSALRLARGIADGKPFGFIDTENRRALHYRAEFPQMQHLDFSPFGSEGEIIGYGPDRWIAAIDAAEAAGLPVVVIDSFSHAWEGIGGVLEMHEEELNRIAGPDADEKTRDKRSQLAWASVKPRYRRLLERIIRARCHIIICIRAKPVMQAWNRDTKKVQNARATKLRRPDLPWDIAADRDLVFEMTASFLMDPAHPGVPIVLKCADAFKPIFAKGGMVDEAAGRAMVAWSTGADDQRVAKKLLDEAREQARKGKAAAAAFWKSLDRPKREIVHTIMDELQDLATAADARASGDDSPFDRDDDAPTLTDDDAERIRREAFAESDRLAEGGAA